MTSTEHRYLGQRIERDYPEIARQLMIEVHPVAEDLDLIPKIKVLFDAIYQSPRGSTKDKTRYRTLFVAVVLCIFDPGAMERFKKGYVRPGLRDRLSNAFDLTPTSVSKLFVKARDYFSIYKPFRRDVEFYFSEIFNQNKRLLEKREA